MDLCTSNWLRCIFNRVLRKFLFLRKLRQGEDFQIFNFLLNEIVSSFKTYLDSIKQGFGKLLFPVYILTKNNMQWYMWWTDHVIWQLKSHVKYYVTKWTIPQYSCVRWLENYPRGRNKCNFAPICTQRVTKIEYDKRIWFGLKSLPEDTGNGYWCYCQKICISTKNTPRWGFSDI